MWALRGPQHRATAFVFPCGDEDSAAVEQPEQCLRDLLKRRRHVIIDVEPVKSLATRLLRLHALRAADALQLGAALHWTEGHPQGRTLHTLDSRLALAAQREGFVVPP